MEHVYELLTVLYQKQQDDNICCCSVNAKAGQARDCQAKLSAFASP